MHSEKFYDIITSLVSEGSRVLDLGCGDGSLMQILKEKKNVRATGVEISEKCVRDSISRGLSVIHANIDDGLEDFQDQSYDYVILSMTLQALHNPQKALQDAVRVGKHVVITFPNFGCWSVRWSLMLSGRMPKTKALPYEWYNTPNIHLLTIKDFNIFCEENSFRITTSLYRGKFGFLTQWFPNLFADNAIYAISAK